MSWWVLISESRRELDLRDRLVELGLSVFMPYESVTDRHETRRGSNVYKVRTRDVALWAPYLFVDGDLAELRAQRGVVDAVRCAGMPVSVPDAVMDRLRGVAVAGTTGLVRARDVSKLSARFGGAVGDRFVFKLGSSLGGFYGRISSVAGLDDTGVVRAWVELFGSEREIDVPVDDVGQLVAASTLSREKVSVAA